MICSSFEGYEGHVQKSAPIFINVKKHQICDEHNLKPLGTHGTYAI